MLSSVVLLRPLLTKSRDISWGNGSVKILVKPLSSYICTSNVTAVTISIFYLIVCFFFNLFLWTYSFPYIQLPLSGTWRWLTMCLSLYILAQSMGNFWIFPYWQSPWSYSSLLIAMFTFHYPYLPPPIHMIGTVLTSIVMATCWPHLFNICFMSFPFFYYFILLCTKHHRLYVHPCKPYLSI